MAFGISRQELRAWKKSVESGHISFITHYWLDDRFPGINTVTKVGCADIDKLKTWGKRHELKEEWIHHRQDGYSHFDLLGKRQYEILKKEGFLDQLKPFLKHD